jgi:hypothetical protein
MDLEEKVKKVIEAVHRFLADELCDATEFVILEYNVESVDLEGQTAYVITYKTRKSANLEGVTISMCAERGDSISQFL